MSSPVDTGPIAPENDETIRRVRATELFISNLLRVGTIASFCIVMLGMIIGFLHHPELLRSPGEYARLTAIGAAFPHSLRNVWNGVWSFHGQAIVEAGILLLVATPVLRVLVSILIFAHQKDRIFTAITTLVFLLLIVSFFLGGER